MRYRIKDYTVEVAGNNLILTIPVSSGIDISASAETVQKLIKEAIRLVVDETAGIVLCSSMQKDKYYSHAEPMPSTQNTRLIFAIPSGKTIAITDQFTIEMDWGDKPSETAKESTSQEILEQVKNVTIDKSDLAKEDTLNKFATKIDNIDLTSVAKQGDNAEATNSKILEEVQKVSSIDTDILQGKIQIASAISSKGVPTLFTDSLQNMANKVGQIKQEVIVGSNGFEQMVIPSQYMWNVYSVAQDIMNISSARVEYLPLYMVNYIKGYAVNSFCVAEYIDITELQLLNADGYLTSDGHFYTHINGVVTHTFPNGEVETYEAETLAHTFEADKFNVWVAYFYFNAGYNFINGDVLSPLRLAICGICGSLTISGTNRINELFVIGELGNINFNSTTMLSGNVCIRNYKNHASSAIFRANELLYSLCMPELESVSGDLFLSDRNNLLSSEPSYLSLPKLHTISSRCFFLASGLSNSMARIEKIYLPKLTNIDVPLCSSILQSSYLFSRLKEISLPILEEINITSTGGGFGTINGLIVSSVNVKNRNYEALKRIHLPKLKKSNVALLKWLNDTSYYQAFNLIDIEVGEYEESLSLLAWTPDNVLADAELTAQLDKNIREHIAMKVQDRKDLSALTITFSQAVRNILTEATEQAFAAKNWNISPAKSV